MTAAEVIVLDPAGAQRRAADPQASVWVAASAGTGKTKVLSDRVLSLMLTGTAPQRILCLTFTKAAAAEMANRIADHLGKWAIDDEAVLAAKLAELLGHSPEPATIERARRLFAEVLDTPGGMNIETIHAFCQSLLRRFPLEAGIAPHFAVMDERDAAEMLAAAREEVLARARQGGDPALAEALAAVTLRVHEAAFPELMGELAAERGRLARLIGRCGSVAGLIAAVRARLGLDPGETASSVVAAACSDEAVDALGLRFAALALADGSDADGERGAAITAWLAAPVAERQRRFASYLRRFLTQDGQTRQWKIRQTLITKAAAAAAPGAEAVLRSEAMRLLGAERHRRAAVTAEATGALVRLGEALLNAYRRHKEIRALLDYDDLILTARDLLRRPGVAPWVLYKLDGGIDHILIDEAQDTNPEQWEVVEALAEEFFAGESAHAAPRTVFAVGDVKQSIFSFQRADPAAFQRMRGLFAERVPAAGGKWAEIPLNISFRSAPAVLRAVDAVFARDPARDGVALDGRPITHAASRRGDAGLVELWPPMEPAARAVPAPWKPPVERVPGDFPRARLARLIARRIRKMIDDREILESRGRPIEAGDVMVLVRRRGGFVAELVRALKELAVEVAGVDRMVLTEQMAVMDLMALGRFLLLPADDLTLATVLKGPLVGLDETRLFRLAYRRPGTLWQALKAGAGDDPVFARAWRELAELLARTDYAPPFELYSHVLGAKRGREKLIARLGREAEDPIGEFLELALAYERAHAASLEGFLNWLVAGAVEIKRDLEQERRNAVRVLTVHGAKGLQAPIVFLPDTLQVPRQGPRLLWPREADRTGRGPEKPADGGADAGDGELLLWPPARDCCEAVAEAARARLVARRDQEYRRLLYVAMTRAEDRLYVCGWQTRNAPPEGCWYRLIEDGLRGLAEAEGVGETEDDFLATEIGSARVLRLTSPQAAAPPTEERPAAAGRATALPPWALRAPPPEPTPPRPLAPSRPQAEEPPVRSPLGTDRGARFKRGRLIHRLLQSLPALAPQARAGAARAYLGRPVHGLSSEEAAEIAAETLKVLADPAFHEVFAQGGQAEVPLVGAVGDQIIAAQVDRLVVTADAVTVIDYKTNRPPPETEGEVPPLYLRQMAAYRDALRLVYPNRPVRCMLLWTDAPSLMALSDRRLDRYAP